MTHSDQTMPEISALIDMPADEPEVVTEIRDRLLRERGLLEIYLLRAKNAQHALTVEIYRTKLPQLRLGDCNDGACSIASFTPEPDPHAVFCKSVDAAEAAVSRLRAVLIDFDVRDIHIIKEASSAAVDILGVEIDSHISCCDEAERTIAELRVACC